MRTRPCVRPLRFSLQNVPVPGSKSFSWGRKSGKISRTQLQLSEEWKVWRTQLQLSEECGKHTPTLYRTSSDVWEVCEVYGQVV
ncbi:hypothetical protein TNCV_3437661 [Trichonephila clavipes]|nr:hypothetical protein TNCV_3437661 [Trichonephila clavipes]